MSEENPKSKKLFYVILSIVFLSIFFVSILGNIVLTGLLVVMSVEKPQAAQAVSYEKRLVSGEGDQEILMIHLKGVISNDKLLTEGWITPEQIEGRLKQAGKDLLVKAVILNINSPGGAITATDKIYRAIIEFREKYKKPVVAYLDSIAASGGYYLASACDAIVCYPTCITGSIGVIMSSFQLQDLLENKLGIKHIVFKSGKHKDILSSTRPVTEQEQKILQDIIDEMYERFLEVVTKGRPALKNLKPEQIREIADGKIYTGKQALEKGLVDKTGTWDDAVAETCILSKIGKYDYRIVMYHQSKSLLQEVLSLSSEESDTKQKILMNLSEKFTTPSFYYLWTAEN
mgnify:CR=1 FL=1